MKWPFVSRKKYDDLIESNKKLFEFNNLPVEERIEFTKDRLIIEYGSGLNALKAWAKIFTTAFCEMAAQNYIEMTLGEGRDKYVCTVRRYLGKTPHQLRKEAEEKLADLSSRLDEDAE